jgi:peptidoglycan/LPS O-acetylase OafA/YrhL
MEESAFAAVLRLERFPVLDGFRALAVGIVVFYHGGFALPGDLGVTAFFVLSGFLITHLLLVEHAKSGRISLRGFYMRRTLRIFPAYYAFFAASLLMDAWISKPWDGQQILSALTYTVNYYNAFHLHQGPITHAWSLAVEEQFYLLWPLAFLALLRFGGIVALRRGLLLCIAFVAVWRTALFLTGVIGVHYAYNSFETRMDSLAIGCLVAVLARSPRFHRVADGSGRWAVLPILTLGVLFLVRSAPEVWHFTIGFTVESMLLGLLLVQLLVLHSSWVASWLDWRPVAYVGALSYPLYLWHKVGFGLGDGFGGSFGFQFTLGIVFSLVIAAGSYHLLERPVMSLRGPIERWWRRARAGTPEPSLP